MSDHRRLSYFSAILLASISVAACSGEAESPVADTPVESATAPTTDATSTAAPSSVDEPTTVPSSVPAENTSTAETASSTVEEYPRDDSIHSGTDSARRIRAGAWSISFEHFTGTHHVVNQGEGYVEFRPDGTCVMDIETIIGWMTFGDAPQFRTIQYIAAGDGDTYSGIVRSNGTEWIRNAVVAIPGSLLVDPSEATRWPLALFCAADPTFEGSIDVDAAFAAGDAQRDAAIDRIVPGRPECAATLRARIEEARGLAGLRKVLTGDAGVNVGGFTATVTDEDDGFTVVRSWGMGFVKIRFTSTDSRIVEVPTNASVPTIGGDWSCDRIADELLFTPSLSDAASTDAS